MRELKITRNYSFWKHPIKWFRDRKKMRFLNSYINSQWENGMREEVQKMQDDMFVYGSTVTKNGKHVDFKKHFNL